MSNALKKIADMIDGVEHLQENTRFDSVFAELSGIVVAFLGESNNLKLCGAFSQELGLDVEEGKTYMLHRGGFICDYCIHKVNDALSDFAYGAELLTFSPSITTVWLPRDENNKVVSLWGVVPDCEHENFRVMHKGEVFCTGAVFYRKDLEKGPITLPTFSVTASITRTIKNPAMSIAQIKDLRKKGYTIEYINDHEVVGFCEVCDRPITEGEEYFSDTEGVLICEDCYL